MNRHTERRPGLARMMLIGSLALLAACGTVQVGSDFDLQTFSAKVQHRVTKQDDIRSWLGEPASKGVVVDTQGHRLAKWTYYFGHGQASDMKQARLKYLEVQFDSDGRVAAYNWSQ